MARYFTRSTFIVRGLESNNRSIGGSTAGITITFDERIHIEIESLNFYIISVTRQARSFTEGIVRCSFFFLSLKSLHQQSLTIFFFYFSPRSLIFRFVSSYSYEYSFFFLKFNHFIFFFFFFPL